MYGITQKGHLADITELLIYSPTQRMWIESHAVPEAEVLDAQVITAKEAEAIMAAGSCKDPVEE